MSDPRTVLSVLLASLAVAAASLLAPSCAMRGDASTLAPSATATVRAPVESLYAEHCADCHGPGGAGDGPAAAWLSPLPRDFGEGRFHIVSTDNGVPTDADLARAIARGSPGTGMPAYPWLGTDRIQALAAHVRRLAIQRMSERLVARWAEVGQPMDRERAADIAQFRMTPGAPVEIPPPVEPTAEVIEHGRRVWLERCAACHGVDGQGRTPDARWAAWDVAFARDLREGLLKGGARHVDLVRRTVAGMPGAAMPPEHFRDPADLQALIAFVATLLPEDADSRGVTVPLELTPARVPSLRDDPTALPDDPTALRDAIPLTGPLWFAPIARRPGSVLRAEVGAAADPERIAIRVRWPDPTSDARALDATADSDAVALQFVADPARPVVGMGRPGAISDIWHWAAFRREETLGVVDLLEASHGLSGAYIEAEGFARPLQRANVVRAAGSRPWPADVPPLDVRVLHAEGHWDLVFVAPRAAVPAIDGRATFGVAIWNGSAEERGAIKSFSGWVRMAR